MSLLGLPVPVPGLYTKNNLNDELRHWAASEHWRDNHRRRLMDTKMDGQTQSRLGPSMENSNIKYLPAGLRIAVGRTGPGDGRAALCISITWVPPQPPNLSQSLTLPQVQHFGQRVHLTLNIWCNELEDTYVPFNWGSLWNKANENIWKWPGHSWNSALTKGNSAQLIFATKLKAAQTAV